MATMETREYGRSKQAGEAARRHVPRAKDGHARGNFLPSVEHGDHV